MKLQSFIAALLLPLPAAFSFTLVDYEIDRARESMQDTEIRLKQCASAKGDLCRRVESLPDKSPERIRLHAEIDETDQVIESLSELLCADANRIHELQASPDYILIHSIDADHRLPTQKDISGVWDFGLMTGYTVQLEQNDKVVRGEGYTWGCIGIIHRFQVHGTYSGRRLCLTYNFSPSQQETHDFRYCRWKGQPAFEPRREKTPHHLIPARRSPL